MVLAEQRAGKAMNNTILNDTHESKNELKLEELDHVSGGSILSSFAIGLFGGAVGAILASGGGSGGGSGVRWFYD